MPVPRKHIFENGQVVGRLTVTGEFMQPRPDGRNRRMIEVACSCGKTAAVTPANLGNGTTTSCGCFHRERATAANTTHGATTGVHKQTKREPLYYVYRGIVSRCGNPNQRNYKWYGGKGVRNEFLDYEDFRSWAEENGWEKGLEVDRICIDLPYSRENCRLLPKGVNLARAWLPIDVDVESAALCYAADNDLPYAKVIEVALREFLAGKPTPAEVSSGSAGKGVS